MLHSSSLSMLFSFRRGPETRLKIFNGQGLLEAKSKVCRGQDGHRYRISISLHAGPLPRSSLTARFTHIGGAAVGRSLNFGFRNNNMNDFKLSLKLSIKIILLDPLFLGLCVWSMRVCSKRPSFLVRSKQGPSSSRILRSIVHGLVNKYSP